MGKIFVGSAKAMRLRAVLRIVAVGIAVSCAGGAAGQDKTKIEIVPLVPHAINVTAVAFSPDGTRVLSGSQDFTLKLWDIASGKLIRTFDAHTSSVAAVTFSPDGTRVLSGSWDKTLKLWDAASGQLLRTFGGHTDRVNSVVFSPDGTRLLSGSRDKTLKLWDAASGQLLRTFEGHIDSVNSVALSPERTRLLAGSRNKTLKLWDAASGQLLRTFEGHTDSVNSIAFSPDGTRLISGSRDKTLKLWDAASGQLLRTFEGHTDSVNSVAFSTDGTRLLSGSGSSAVSGSKDDNVKLWDAASGKLVRTFEGFSSWMWSVASSPDGTRLLWGTGDKTLMLWDAATGQLLRTLRGHSGAVHSVTFSPDGTRLLSGSWDRTLKLWDAASGKLLRTFEGHTDGVSSVAFSPSGTRVLSGSADGTLKLWDAASGKLLHTLKGHAGQVNSVAFSPDGTWVLSGSSDKTLKLWDAETGAILLTLEGHTDRVNSVVFSPDGTLVLSASTDNTLKLWDAANGELIRTLKEPLAYVVAFTPDGARLISGSENGWIKLWDGATGHLIHAWEGHTGAVGSLALSPDGKRLLSSSNDTAVRIWNSMTGQLFASLFGARDGEWLSITPNGFFSASHRDTDMLAIVRGMEVTTIGQVHQSLFNPDLVREALTGDTNGEVARAVEVINLDKVIDSGPAPLVEITPHPPGSKPDTDLVTVTARITDRGKGIGRIEWRVVGITVGVKDAPAAAGPVYEVSQELALDAGENAIEVVAYNGRNLLASLPAQTTISYAGDAGDVKPKLHVLAIGINTYTGVHKLELAVADAKAIAAELQKAGTGIYSDVRVQTALDAEATAAGLDRIVQEFAAGIAPRDTFVLFAAAHGYSDARGRFYLIPQDYPGGLAPETLGARAIGQERLQDWIANRIKAKKALILLDTCESGALVNGYAQSRVTAQVSEAALGRLHEATGRPVLTAAAAGKPALEADRLGHGVFTAALIDALYHGDTNGDGLIQLSELAAHVEDMVPKLSAKREGQGRAAAAMAGAMPGAQSAHFGSTGGDFAIVRRLP